MKDSFSVELEAARLKIAADTEAFLSLKGSTRIEVIEYKEREIKKELKKKYGKLVNKKAKFIGI